jgi:hypothetical protein
VAAYRWKGFGFEGITDDGIVLGCRALFDEKADEKESVTP